MICCTVALTSPPAQKACTQTKHKLTVMQTGSWPICLCITLNVQCPANCTQQLVSCSCIGACTCTSRTGFVTFPPAPFTIIACMSLLCCQFLYILRRISTYKVTSLHLTKEMALCPSLGPKACGISITSSTSDAGYNNMFKRNAHHVLVQGVESLRSAKSAESNPAGPWTHYSSCLLQY